MDVDLICTQIDDYVERDDDWETYDYSAALRTSMAYLDAQPMTFAAMYDEDGNDISDRTESYEGAPFIPMLDPNFLDEVCKNESGDYVMAFTPKGEPTRDMRIYYRWVPSNRQLEGRYLLVVAISTYSISTPMAVWYTIGSVGNIIITFAIEVALVLLYIRAGRFYDARDGRGEEKWRGDTDDNG